MLMTADDSDTFQVSSVQKVEAGGDRVTPAEKLRVSLEVSVDIVLSFMVDVAGMSGGDMVPVCSAEWCCVGQHGMDAV